MSNWRISQRARRDLAEIWRYSYSQWGLQQADRYVARLYEAFSKLVANPSLGRAVPAARKATSKYRCGSHLIFHRWPRKQLHIIRILHESMDHKQQLS
jgi:toxin ParE1/3/4